MLQDRRKIKNRREDSIAKLYMDQGFDYLKKGWPDFLFFRASDGKLIFVEVKRKQRKPSNKMGLSKHQRSMKSILEKIGEYRIEYVD